MSDFWAIRFDFENQSKLSAKFFTTMVETKFTVKQKYLTEPTTIRPAQAVEWNARKGEEKERNVSPCVFVGPEAPEVKQGTNMPAERPRIPLKAFAAKGNIRIHLNDAKRLKGILSGCTKCEL